MPLNNKQTVWFFLLQKNTKNIYIFIHPIHPHEQAVRKGQFLNQVW